MYTDLSGTKKVNGLPADQDVLAELIGNQSHFNDLHDNDEDLSALDRNITPIADGVYDIGELGAKIANFFAEYIRVTNRIEVGHGSAGSLPFTFEGESLGLYRSAPGQMTFVSGANEVLDISSSGARLKAANPNQLLLESIESGLEDTWGIGGNVNGMTIFNASSGITDIIRFLSAYIQPLVPVQLPNGDASNPVLTFTSDTGVGFYKDSISARTTWVINNNNRLAIDDLTVEIESGQFVVPDGTTTAPSLTFSTGLSTGFNRLANGDLEFVVDSYSPASLTQEGFRPLAVASDQINGPQVDMEVDVSNTSKIVVDCTGGDVSIRSLNNAVEGTVFYIVMAEPTGTLTVRHDDLAATSSMLLKGSTDFVITNDYGGLVLSYDQGVWREVSRS